MSYSSYVKNREKKLSSLYKTLGGEGEDLERQLNSQPSKFATTGNEYWDRAVRKDLRKISRQNELKIQEEKFKNIPSVPKKNIFSDTSNTPLPKYGYSMADRSNAKSYVPNYKKSKDDEDDDFLKYAKGYRPKSLTYVDGKKKTVTKDKEDIINSYINKGKKQSKKVEDLHKGDTLKSKIYTDVVEPVLIGGLIEPAADIGSILTLDKEGKKEYNKNLNTYKDSLSGLGKASNVIGSIGANIGMSNALGLDKLKLANNKYLNSAIKEGLENTIIEGGLDLAKGNTDNFVKNRVGDFTGGAAFGVGTNALGDMVRGIKNIDGKLTKAVNDTFDTSDMANLDLDDNLTNINNKAKEIRKLQEQALNKNKKSNLKDIEFKYDDRTFEDLRNVGNRKVKSITENMYELKPYIQNQAKMVLEDMRFGTKGGETAINKATNGRTATSRLQSETFDIIQAQTGKSYAEIKKALEKVANGEINDALTKKIELILDDSLINGTRLADGLEIPANNDYIETKKMYDELSKGNLNVLNEPINDFNSSNTNLPLNNENSIESLLDTKKEDILNGNKKTFVEPMEIKEKPINNVIPNEMATTKLEDNKKLSKHKSDTMMDSDNITDELKEELSKYDLDYTTSNNKADWEEAVLKAKDENSFNNYMRSAGTTEKDTMLGEALIQKLQSSGNDEDLRKAIDVANKLSMDLTQAGKTVQAASVLNKLTPEGKLVYTQRQIKKYNDSLPKGKKKIELDEKSAKEILDHMKKAQTLEGDAKNVEIAKANKVIKEIIPPTLFDKIDSFRYINMLFNPKTLVKNFAGNVVNVGAGQVRDLIGNQIDNLISKKTGIKSVYNPNLKALGEGFVDGGKRTFRDYKEGIETTLDGKEGAVGNAFRDSNNIIGKGMGKISDLLGLGLKVGDEPFKQGLYDEYIAGYMKNKGIKNISEVPNAIKEEAYQVALEGTYQEKNALNDIINYAKNKNKGAKLAIDAILPFVKTPVNIAKTAIDYSPIGLGKGIYNTSKALSGNADNLLRTQRKGASQLASGLMGTGLMGAGAYLGKNDILSGNFETDRDKRKFDEQTGGQTYAINTGDKTIGVDFMQPLTTSLMVGADLGKGNTDLRSLLGTAINSFAGNTFLNGITDLSKNMAYGDVSGALTSAVDNYSNQMLPFNSLASAVNRSIDPTIRETYSDSMLGKFKNQALSKYPLLAQQLPQRVDTLGKPMVNNEGVGSIGNILRNTIIPTTVKDVNLSSQEKAIQNAYKDSGSNTVFPYSPTGKDFSFREGSANNPLGKVSLTEEEFSKYSKLVGDYTNSKINSSSSAEDIEEIIKNAREYAKNIILKDRGLTKYKKGRKEFYR